LLRMASTKGCSRGSVRARASQDRLSWDEPI
jgi:hypothetical protein